MRIGLFSDTYLPDINGVAISVYTLQQALMEQGHEVFVITTHHSLLAIEYEDNVLRLPGFELKKLYGYVFTTPVQIRAFMHVRDMKLDIIHAHTEFGVGMFAHICGKMLKLPIALTYHTTYEDYTHYINKYNIKAIDKFAKSSVIKISRIFASSSRVIIAPSQKTKEMLLRYGITREIKVIPTGLDLDRFNPHNKNTEKIKQFREQMQVKNHEQLLIFIGRLAKEKSVDDVIEGFALLKAKRNDVKLVIVGGGPSEADLKALVQALRLENDVIFFGKVNSEDVPCAYHMADAFISASTTETQGLTYIEALASGLVVFARDDEAISSIIKQGENGYLFDDVETLAQQLDEYLALDLEQKAKIRAHAQEAVQVYSKANFAKSVLSAYELAQEIYMSAYTIESMKQVNGHVIVHLKNRYDHIDVELLEETVVEKALIETKMVTKDELSELLEDEKLSKAYKKCIVKLASRDLSHKELHDFLMDDPYLNMHQLESLLDILERQGLIDDKQLATMIITSMQEKLYGKHKVMNKLRDRGIADELIASHFDDLDDKLESKRAHALAIELQGKVSDVSVIAKKEKLKKRLVYRGYDVRIAQAAVNMLNYDVEAQQELENCAKLAQKQLVQFKRRTFKDKYDKRKRLSYALAKKGFKFDMINEVIGQLESEGQLDD